MGEAVALPHGYWVDGRHCREVGLRALTGRDEEYLNEITPLATPVECVTDLLARCIVRMEGRGTVTRDAVAGLVAGDREALLWRLRRLTLGERLQTTLFCPVEVCGKPMDLTLDLDDLLQSPYADPRQEYVGEQEGLRIRFRLPTGLDLEQVCGHPIGHEEAAAERLLARCIVGVSDGGRALEEWSADALRSVPDLMEELDPQAELLLDVTCPECGGEFSALLDATDYLLREISNHGEDLYRQVHSLALYYHWSEAEILGLTPAKRRRYLELLSDSLSEAAPL